MAFWALGAFDKLKNISIEKVTKKVKDYVHAPMQQDTPKPKQQQQIARMTKVRVQLNERELMEIQLRQYKKLLKLQEKIEGEYERKKKEDLERRQEELLVLQKELIQQEDQERKSEEKKNLLQAIQSGKRSIEQIIQENIEIKQKIYFTRQK